jgi:hypothetical protein
MTDSPMPKGVFPRIMASGETWYQATAKIKDRVVWLGLWSTPAKALKAQQRALS